MKNKGFTLLELIGTVVILAIIMLIALPAILSMLTEGQKTVDDAAKEIVKSAANKYVGEHKSEVKYIRATGTSIKNHGEISTETLRDEGYLEKEVYDKYELNNDCVVVTSNNKKYFYEYKEDCE